MHTPGNMGTTRKWLNTASGQLIAFFVLTYILTWSTWIPVFGDPQHVPSQLSFVGLFAPAISAILVAGLTGGRAGIWQLLRRYFVWGLDMKWSIATFLLVPAIFIVAALVLSGRSLHELLLGNPWYFVAASFAFLLVINSGEEIGWRSFALPRLQGRLGSPLLASLLLGLIWGLWHWPEYLNPAQSSFPFPVFLFFTVGLSISYTALFNRSSGSLLVAVIYHASTDIMPRILNIGGFTVQAWLGIAGLTWVAGLLLYWFTRTIALIKEP